MKKEKKLQDKCIKYLRSKGYYTLNLYGDGMSGKGKPDVITCINGRFVAFELKVEDNKMQADQKIHAIRIKRSGGMHYCPYTFDEFVECVKEVEIITWRS